ncbi:extracellular solute-binding protein [Salinibacterium sp. ZJ70]|uniref:sugar ABC transporter substrate-binding protein n=1 Tax=Salinibacterium sp. ZJ70 TaxID=2708084 RepID=UPI0014249BB8|nr:extracellular solute-binding protein [Salinibacterium sp. ZJ70]
MNNMTRGGAVALGIVSALVLAGCGSGGEGDSAGDQLTILIGSSGPAETEAVQSAADAWAADHDAEVTVIAADDLNQQLSQGFAGDDAPDLFYMSWDQFDNYAQNGYLEPYAADLDNAEAFYPALIDVFTYDNEFVCAPKDFSTLGLVINTEMWAAAGLTAADVPTDWDSLQAVATTLTTGDVVGLSFGLEYARLGVFMNQAGGSVLNEDGTEVTVDSPENLAGLEYVQKLHDAGVLKFPSEIDAGWGGEALGAGKAAMVIEGPWIQGIENDYPETIWEAYELPQGPAGPSTFTFTNCWGIPTGSDSRDDAVSLVEHLTSDDQQLEFADAFGVIPSTEEAAKSYADQYPAFQAFVTSNDYAVSPVNFAGSASAVGDFNSQIEGLATGGVDLTAVLATFQEQLQAALDENG